MKTLLRIAGQSVFLREDGALQYDAGMTIDADGSPRAYHPDDTPGLDFLAYAGRPGNWWALACNTHGNPFIQTASDPAPGFYVSTTAYERQGFAASDPMRYLDSEHVKFVVVPRQLRRMVKGIVLGCRAVVTNLITGQFTDAVVGDIGPVDHLGEGSIALAKELGVPANPRRGGAKGDIKYEIFPGVAAPGFRLQAA